MKKIFILNVILLITLNLLYSKERIIVDSRQSFELIDNLSKNDLVLIGRIINKDIIWASDKHIEWIDFQVDSVIKGEIQPLATGKSKYYCDQPNDKQIIRIPIFQFLDGFRVFPDSADAEDEKRIIFCWFRFTNYLTIDDIKINYFGKENFSKGIEVIRKIKKDGEYQIVFADTVRNVIYFKEGEVENGLPIGYWKVTSISFENNDIEEEKLNYKSEDENYKSTNNEDNMQEDYESDEDYESYEEKKHVNLIDMLKLDEYLNSHEYESLKYSFYSYYNQLHQKDSLEYGINSKGDTTTLAKYNAGELMYQRDIYKNHKGLIIKKEIINDNGAYYELEYENDSLVSKQEYFMYEKSEILLNGFRNTSYIVENVEKTVYTQFKSESDKVIGSGTYIYNKYSNKPSNFIGNYVIYDEKGNPKGIIEYDKFGRPIRKFDVILKK